ncbi:DUF309 domain-containing protein [Mesorhizobium sp. C374B]|nr:MULTISPECIES: DUF309 domain-containing protein [unclassified Mesorhizobium]WJI80955.1 DUF309 domain-containing protein [Mesorhizobium sp. C374B]WJI87494.1 DUF309 domain-containing protein [Mesorhizobium sp. C372A]
MESGATPCIHHEAWDHLWHGAKQSTQHRLFFKGLTLLAVAGMNMRDGERVAAARHAARPAALFLCPAGPLRPHSE